MDPILYHMDRMEAFPWSDSFKSGTWQIDYPDYLKSSRDKQHLMSLVSTMTDKRGEAVGVVEAVISMDDMFPRIYSGGADSWSCFVQEDGTIFSMGEDSLWEEYRDEIVSESMESNEKGYVHTNIGGKEVILVKKHLEDFPGTYICLSDLSQQLRQMVLQQVQNFLFIALVFL